MPERTLAVETEASDDATTDTEPEPDTDPDATHLDDVEDGCGCAEICEHLSERRADD
jgi:hypothetical protein